MYQRLSIGRKIAMAVATFLLPVAFILWLLAGGQGKDIRFAEREVAGVTALRGLLAAELGLDRTILGARPAGVTTGGLLSPALPAFGTLGLAREAAALMQADGGNPAQVRTLLRALVASVGDRSNLILDNVLDSYYATDVVLNRLPDVLDNIADLRALAAAQGGSPDAKAAFLVAQGGLDGVLAGMDSSMQSAVQDNTDGTLAPRLAAKYSALKGATTAHTASLRGGAGAGDGAGTLALIDQVGDFADSGAGALQAILQARVSALGRTRLVDFAATGVLFAFATLSTLWVIRSGVVQRINVLRDSMVALARDQDIAEIPFAGDGDEIGQMARTLQVFRENRRLRLEAEAQARDVAASRDRRQQSMDRHTEDFATAMAGTMAGLTHSASAMSDIAVTLLSAAESTGDEAAATAVSAEASSGNLSAVAAAVEEMTASALEIARRIVQASESAREAVSRTESADGAVRGLSEAAVRIGAIANVIEQIASRTNLLALNATIEAARAGEAGRGFAVVAAEVKQLAGQTAHATRDIAVQIGAIRAATINAAAAMEGVGAAIRDVNDVAAAISAAAAQQGATTREIASSVGLVAAATAQTAGSMRNVSDTTTSSRDMSAAVADAAGRVTRQSEALRAEVEQFVAVMREPTNDMQQRTPGTAA